MGEKDEAARQLRKQLRNGDADPGSREGDRARALCPRRGWHGAAPGPERIPEENKIKFCPHATIFAWSEPTGILILRILEIWAQPPAILGPSGVANP